MLFPVTDLQKKDQKSSQQLIKQGSSFNLEKGVTDETPEISIHFKYQKQGLPAA